MKGLKEITVNSVHGTLELWIASVEWSRSIKKLRLNGLHPFEQEERRLRSFLLRNKLFGMADRFVVGARLFDEIIVVLGDIAFRSRNDDEAT